jgi:hypothetical protein
MQNFLRKQVLENLEPELYFAKYGQVSKAENGYLTLSWARFDQLTRTVAQVTLTEGVTPTEVDATVTVVQATPVQYGMQVVISDFLQKTSPISSILELVGREVAANMMRVIDKVIQAELSTNGTNVIYANGRVARVNLISTDVVTGSDISKVAIKLRKQNAKTISEGCYVGIVDNFVAGDIRNTSSGLWLDANKYVTNGAILLMVKLVNSKVLRLLKQATSILLFQLLLSTLLTLLVRTLTVLLIGKIWRLSSTLLDQVVQLMLSINVLLSVLKLHSLQRCYNRMLSYVWNQPLQQSSQCLCIASQLLPSGSDCN